MFSGPPGTDETCPICAWQDDVSQLRFPMAGGGANEPSLIEAQRNFAAFGASTKALLSRVRAPSRHDHREGEWRPIGRSDMLSFHHERAPTGASDYPSDYTDLYYWRTIPFGAEVSADGVRS